MVDQVPPALQAVIDLNQEISALVTSLGGEPYAITVGEDGRVVIPEKLKNADAVDETNDDANDNANNDGANNDTNTDTNADADNVDNNDDGGDGQNQQSAPDAPTDTDASKTDPSNTDSPPVNDFGDGNAGQ